jgi:hypothetical protein
MQVAGVSSTSCGAGCRLADATGALSLTDADRELYKACTTGTAPDGSTCSDAERSCYKCFCCKAISDGMLRYVYRLLQQPQMTLRYLRLTDTDAPAVLLQCSVIPCCAAQPYQTCC